MKASGSFTMRLTSMPSRCQSLRKLSPNSSSPRRVRYPTRPPARLAAIEKLEVSPPQPTTKRPTSERAPSSSALNSSMGSPIEMISGCMVFLRFFYRKQCRSGRSEAPRMPEYGSRSTAFAGRCAAFGNGLAICGRIWPSPPAATWSHGSAAPARPPGLRSRSPSSARRPRAPSAPRRPRPGRR